MINLLGFFLCDVVNDQRRVLFISPALCGYFQRMLRESLISRLSAPFPDIQQCILSVSHLLG